MVHEDCFDEDVIEELARRMAAAGIEAFFETNVATFALEPAGVEQSSLIGTSVVHSTEEMRVDAVCAWARYASVCPVWLAWPTMTALSIASLSCATPVARIAS